MSEAGKTRDGKDQAAIADRRRRALVLRLAGASYPEIARQLGLAGPGSSYKIVQKALKATYQEPADEVRKLELERLDRLQLAIWGQATGSKDKPPDHQALDRVLKIQSLRMALLGIDARTTIQVEQHRELKGRVEALEQIDDEPNGPRYPARKGSTQAPDNGA